MIRFNYLLIGVVYLGMAAGVFSQEEHPYSRRGRFGAIQPSFLCVLAEPAIRSELKLSDDQERRIGEILSHRPTPIRPQGLGAEETRKRASEEWSKVVSQDEEAAKMILTNAQRVRVDQIVTQIWGVLVVVRPDIAELLGITDEQKKKLREINRSGPQSPAIGNPRKVTDEQRRAIDEWVAARNKLEVEMLAVLSNEQKSKFAKIRGEPFAFPPTQVGANLAELLKDTR